MWHVVIMIRVYEIDVKHSTTFVVQCFENRVCLPDVSSIGNFSLIKGFLSLQEEIIREANKVMFNRQFLRALLHIIQRSVSLLYYWKKGWVWKAICNTFQEYSLHTKVLSSIRRLYAHAMLTSGLGELQDISNLPCNMQRIMHKVQNAKRNAETVYRLKQMLKTILAERLLMFSLK